MIDNLPFLSWAKQLTTAMGTRRALKVVAWFAIAFMFKSEAVAADYVVVARKSNEVSILFKDMAHSLGNYELAVHVLVVNAPAIVVNGADVYYTDRSFIFNCNNKTFRFFEDIEVGHSRQFLGNRIGTQESRTQATQPTGAFAQAVAKVCDASWSHSDRSDFDILDRELASLTSGK